jgi:hypothetical protein
MGPPESRPDPGAGLVLAFQSPGYAEIRDDSQTLRSRRYLASLVHDVRGWTLTVHRHGVYGPFPSAAAGAEWYAAHRGALPEPVRPRLLSDDWPP